MKLDKDSYDALLANSGWRLTHFEDGSKKQEWYRAAKALADGGEALQSAGSQELLVQRCQSWDETRAARKVPAKAAPRVSVKATAAASGDPIEAA